MNSDYTLPINIRITRPLIRVFFRGLFRILGQVKITGKENVPRDGAYIIAINHVSIFDPPFAGSFWPIAPEVVGAAVVWDRPGQGAIVKMYGSISIHRSQFDRRMVDLVLAAFKSGRPLMIAPEGTRSHVPGLLRAKPGIAYLADKADVPVIPVAIIGTTEDYFQKAIRGKQPSVEMCIGNIFHLPKIEGRGAKKREQRQNNADQVMYRIAELLPPEYRGVYGDESG